MTQNIPPIPPNSVRITLDLRQPENRLDVVLLNAIRDQGKALGMLDVSRTTFKKLFNDGKILIKGQRAKPSSALAKGITYVDILK